MDRKVAMIGLLVMAAAAQAAAAVPPAEAEMPAAAAHWWRTWWVWGACAALALAGCVWAWQAAHRRAQRWLALQRTRTECELASRALAAKTRFLADLGHEVRTPMTGIMGMSELLLATRLDPDQRTYAETIHRAGQHLLRLVNDVLEFSRGGTETPGRDPRPLDLQALVSEVCGLMAPMAQRQGLEFRSHLASALPQWVSGDGTGVRQILINLLNNAIKFTECGRVELMVQAVEPAGVRFTVADSGPGLTAEQQSRLFQRFEQGEGARTAARYGGFGLGLSICRDLASAMGGTILVDSSPGNGARFVVELPLPPVRAVPGGVGRDE